MRRFARWARLKPDARVLDVGGLAYYWLYEAPPKVTLINLEGQQNDIPDEGFDVAVGDGRNLPYPDAAFDLAFSASVIEHLGAWEDQKLFASELRRVGNKVYCQTPAKAFPLEPHYLAPFVHWLPKPVRRRLIRNLTPWGWMVRPSAEMINDSLSELRLLSYREMKRLFPDCEIRRERLLGFTRAYIALRDSSDGAVNDASKPDEIRQQAD
jgi:hypothetical protein